MEGERQLDGAGRTRVARIAGLAEDTHDGERGLAASPGFAALRLAAEARLPVHDTGAREVAAAEIVVGAVQDVGDEPSHDAEVSTPFT